MRSPLIRTYPFNITLRLPPRCPIVFGKNLSRLFLFTLCKINFEVLLHEYEENWQTFLCLSGNIKKRNVFLPLQLTEDIARRTDVDKYAKKVSFSGFVNLFLYSATTSHANEFSLRKISRDSKRKRIADLFNMEHVGVSSLSEYLSSTNIEPFLMLFHRFIVIAKDKVSQHHWKYRNVEIFDTTYLGYLKSLADGKVSEIPIRLTLKINGATLLPSEAILDMENGGDNGVFMEMVYTVDEGKIYVFDRGFTELSVMYEVTENNNYFITRMVKGYREVIIKRRRQQIGAVRNELRLVADDDVLVGADNNEGQRIYRKIIFEDERKKQLVFLTNLWTLDPWEIAVIYRMRWLIEIVFRWLKSWLGLTHLISRSWNGIMIEVLLLLVLMALLVMIYVMSHGINSKMSLCEALSTLRGILDYWLMPDDT